MRLGTLITTGDSSQPLRYLQILGGSPPVADLGAEIVERQNSLTTSWESSRWIQVSKPNSRKYGCPLTKISAINGMMCTYASKEDIDNWEKLGNPGWSHADLAPYFKKFESFTEPSEDIAKFYHTDEVIDKHLHNGGGPVKTSFPPNKRVGGNAWVKTFDKMGLKMDADPQSGFGNGGYSLVLILILEYELTRIQEISIPSTLHLEHEVMLQQHIISQMLGDQT
jgi:hypothetical protein